MTRKPKSRGNISREDILSAAIRCLKRLGVSRTRIIDIAEEAGVSRRTIYRLFETKEAVLESLASARIVELAGEQQVSFSRFTSLREALVEGTMIGVTKGRTDTLVRDVFVSGGHTSDQLFFAGSEEVNHHMMLLWTPLLDRARESGELREGITNEAAVEWIRNIHGVMIVRDDYDDKMRRKIATDFLVPSLVRDEPAAKPARKRRQ